ncbi:MAG: hypothetical protein AWM53_00493 [Candidatus Dichloromethanomonas elyunquensis]|nr:MAG: hypothetical protein AWM53_00493 [Candidatus Dichloromethanomonas elyunquensis]
MKEINRNVLNFWAEKEKKLEAAHLLDLCETVLRDKERLVTPFLSPAMADWFRTVLKGTGLCFSFWGGFEEAERVRFVLNGNGTQPETAQTEIALVKAAPNKKGVILGHRDILGSLLGLGLEREVLGDIRQAEDGAVIAVTTQMHPYIIQNWESVGREFIQASIAGSSKILPLAGLEKRAVVSSPRLDTLAAAGFGLSRSEVQELVRQGKVKKNDLECVKPDIELKAGDTVSCRGQGKMKIVEESSKTRKGKYAWRVFIYRDS